MDGCIDGTELQTELVDVFERPPLLEGCRSEIERLLEFVGLQGFIVPLPIFQKFLFAPTFCFQFFNKDGHNERVEIEGPGPYGWLVYRLELWPLSGILYTSLWKVIEIRDVIGF